VEENVCKKPNKFALFVKENYAQEKKSGLKHCEVMRNLGERFKTVSLTNQDDDG